MTVNLLVSKAVAISKHGVQLYRSHRLPDNAYGEYLIYEGVKPVYYLNLFDRAYNELSSHQLTSEVPTERLITQLLQLHRHPELSVREAVWLRFRCGSKEDVIAYKLQKLPIEYLIGA